MIPVFGFWSRLAAGGATKDCCDGVPLFSTSRAESPDAAISNWYYMINCAGHRAFAEVPSHSQAAPFACFLRNTSLKSVKPDCAFDSSSLRRGTCWLMWWCDEGGDPKSTRPVFSGQ